MGDVSFYSVGWLFASAGTPARCSSGSSAEPVISFNESQCRQTEEKRVGRVQTSFAPLGGVRGGELFELVISWTMLNLRTDPLSPNLALSYRRHRFGARDKRCGRQSSPPLSTLSLAVDRRSPESDFPPFPTSPLASPPHPFSPGRPLFSVCLYLLVAGLTFLWW